MNQECMTLSQNVVKICDVSLCCRMSVLYAVQYPKAGKDRLREGESQPQWNTTPGGFLVLDQTQSEEKMPL
jgi:hypothetical protein